MKIRRMKKRHYAAFKRHRAFLWSVKKLTNKIFDAYRPMAKALQDAYMRGNFVAQVIDDDGTIRVIEIPQEQLYDSR